MLVKPFPETDAFKFGIIDKNGKKLRDPETEEEKDSFDYLSRLTFNLKKLLNKLPGGDTKLKNIVAALYLIKEQYKSNIDSITEEELQRILNLNVILVEETLQVRMFMEDGAPTNVSMPAPAGTPSKVSTDVPIKRKKTNIMRRQNLNPVAVDLNQKSL
jgi:hypothetical protein